MTITHCPAVSASAPTYALHRTNDRAPVGHTTSLPTAVTALAALLGRSVEDLHTEQLTLGDWAIYAGAERVGAIAAAVPSSAP